MFLFVISQMPKFYYDNHLRTFVGPAVSLANSPFCTGVVLCQRKEKNSADSTPFVMGVITLLKQFHSIYTQKFLAYLGQYVRGIINVTIGK